MHLRDYLHDIPLKALKTIAETLEISVEYRARIKLMNAIDRAFWDGTLVERLVTSLPEERLNVLSFIAFSYDTGISRAQIASKMERLYGVSPKTTDTHINELIPLALIAGINDEQEIFFCPVGIAGHVRRIILRETVIFSGRDENPQVFSQPDFMEDIFSFLAHAYKKPLPLTLMGKVRKSTLERIFDDSPTCSDKSLKLTPEKRNAAVIDYLVDRKLVTFGNQTVVTTTRFESWLDLSGTERVSDIVAFLLSSVLKDTETIASVNGFLVEIPSGSTFSAAVFSDFIDRRTAAPGGSKRLESRLTTLLAILSRLGIFLYMDGYFHMTVTGEKLMRGDKIPMDEAQGESFTIQPNFEAIVGPELKPRIRFIMELMADRTSRDTVLCYSIKQEGIARAREQGMTTDQIMRFFHEHSRTPIPQNVGFSIEEWSNSYGSIFFEKVMLMRCRDEAISERVVHSPEIAPYILEQISDTAIIVSASHIKTLSQKLKKAGFLPEAYEDDTVSTDRTDSHFEAKSLDTVLKDNRLPTIYQNFIFPSELFEEENGQ